MAKKATATLKDLKLVLREVGASQYHARVLAKAILAELDTRIALRDDSDIGDLILPDMLAEFEAFIGMLKARFCLMPDLLAMCKLKTVV